MNVSVSGHHKEDPLSHMIIDKQVRNELERLNRLLPVQDIQVHIDRYKETGKRVKYSIKLRLMTDKGLFFSHDHAWDLAKALSGALKKLEREVVKKKEKLSKA